MGKFLYLEANKTSLSPDFDLPGLLLVLHHKGVLRLRCLLLHAVLENVLCHSRHTVLLVLPLPL